MRHEKQARADGGHMHRLRALSIDRATAAVPPQLRQALFSRATTTSGSTIGQSTTNRTGGGGLSAKCRAILGSGPPTAQTSMATSKAPAMISVHIFERKVRGAISGSAGTRGIRAHQRDIGSLPRALPYNQRSKGAISSKKKINSRWFTPSGYARF